MNDFDPAILQLGQSQIFRHIEHLVQFELTILVSNVMHPTPTVMAIMPSFFSC
jgi:hypothetical protein